VTELDQATVMITGTTSRTFIRFISIDSSIILLRQIVMLGMIVALSLRES
jgi:hypothetical protein